MEANPTEFQDIIDGKYSLVFSNNIQYLGENNDQNEDEFEVSAYGQDAGDDKFDQIVGALQDILLDPKFESMTKQFTNKYCMEFEASEENKLCYTGIFKEY